MCWNLKVYRNHAAQKLKSSELQHFQLEYSSVSTNCGYFDPMPFKNMTDEDVNMCIYEQKFSSMMQYSAV